MKQVVRSSASLFSAPVPYETKHSRKTTLVVLDNDSEGNTVKHYVSVEDEMARLIQLDFREVTLSNLVEKGVDPHGLDMIDTNKLGCDSGAEELYNHLIDNIDEYVETSKSV